MAKQEINQQESGGQTPHPEKQERKHIFKPGDMVSIMRSSGELEHDWYVQEYSDDDHVIVGKKDKNRVGKILYKTLPEDELDKLQGKK